MSNVSNFGVGLMHEFAIEASKAGFEPHELAQLKESKLREIREVLLGYATINLPERTIDCTVTPASPWSGWSACAHDSSRGKWAWKRSDIRLTTIQLARSMRGENVLTRFVDRQCVNACVPLYLEKYPHLIAPDWKGKKILFPGTRFAEKNYQDNQGVLGFYHNQGWWSFGMWEVSDLWDMEDLYFATWRR